MSYFNYFDKLDKKLSSIFIEKDLSRIKYGVIGALIALFLYPLAFTGFLGVVIPVGLIFYPFIYLGQGILHNPNLFIYPNPRWLDFSLFITPMGILLLITIGFLVGQFIRHIRYPSKAIIRPTLYITLALFVMMSLLYSAKYFNSYLTCSMLPYSSDQGDCFLDMAVKFSKPSLCEEITGNLKETCYNEVAQKTSNISLCDKAGENYYEFFGCYRGILSSPSDPTSCNNIPEAEPKNACMQALALTTKDPSQCTQLDTTGNQNTCLYRMACQFKDESLCNSINTEKGRKQCVFGMENTQYDSNFNSCLGKGSEYLYELHIDE